MATKTYYVVSSLIKQLEYDPDDFTLIVTLHSGNSYRYFNIPPDLFAAFLRSPSLGSFWNKHIRNIKKNAFSTFLK